MSPREGMYYVGMITGMVAGVSFSRLMGWHHLIGLLCGVVVGLPLGILCEKLYSRATGPRKSSDASQRSCENPECQWTGDPGFSGICPRCGRALRK